MKRRKLDKEMPERVQQLRSIGDLFDGKKIPIVFECSSESEFVGKKKEFGLVNTQVSWDEKSQTWFLIAMGFGNRDAVDMDKQIQLSNLEAMILYLPTNESKVYQWWKESGDERKLAGEKAIEKMKELEVKKEKIEL